MKGSEEQRTQNSHLDSSARQDGPREEQVKWEEGYFANAYHGLLQPIQSISGYLELLLDGKVPDIEQRNQFLTIAYREAQYLANRLSDLLIASQIESGEFEIHPSPFSLNELIEARLQRLKPKAAYKEMHLRLTKTDLPPVNGDEKLLGKVIMALLDTLIKFAPRGAEVTVGAILKEEEIMVHLIDGSGGLTEEILTALGQHSHDASHASANATTGLSLGLHIAKHIIQAHGGRIWFRATPDRGSAFRFTLPLQPKIEQAKPQAARKSKILIVDDEPAPLELMEYALQQEGFQTFKASNGIEALQVIDRQPVDLVVLDVMLPGMDGYEVCHRLRSNPETADLPVLMVSAKAREEDKATALRVGAQAYFKKPFSMSDLIAGVNKLLADTRRERQREDHGIPIIH